MGCKGRVSSILAAAAILVVVATPGGAADLGFRPDPRVTPGALNPDVNPGNFHEEICIKGASRFRPEPVYTSGLKRKQLREMRYEDTNPAHYEEDHLIPLSLGGHPRDPRNLWPEPWDGEWGARAKDRLEFALYKAACRGEISLAEAQSAFAVDWISAYPRYQALMNKYRFREED